MTRRGFIRGAAGAAAAVLGATGARAQSGQNPRRFLAPTAYIDSTEPTVAAHAARLTAGLETNRDKALALFAFVRDEIPFGFAGGFWAQKASDVLAAGRGYCNTKSTLFVALLRASGVPARQVFVEIHASVLHGIIDAGTPYLDHSYTEVFLDGAWRATDAYIVDAALFEPAQRRVRAEERLMGYGVHATGTVRWDGHEPAFAQYNVLDPRPLGSQRWGVYADVGDFYRHADDPWNRQNALVRAGFGLLASGANRRIDAIRRGA